MGNGGWLPLATTSNIAYNTDGRTQYGMPGDGK